MLIPILWEKHCGMDWLELCSLPYEEKIYFGSKKYTTYFLGEQSRAGAGINIQGIILFHIHKNTRELGSAFPNETYSNSSFCSLRLLLQIPLIF